MSKIANFYTEVAERIAWNFYDGSLDATGMLVYIAECYGTSLLETCHYISAILEYEDGPSMMPEYHASDDFSDVGEAAYVKATEDLAEAAAILAEYLERH